MLGFIVLAALGIFAAILGMKLIPPYMHNAQIESIFKSIAADPAMQSGSVKDIKESFSKRASINYITDISAEDIDIGKNGAAISLSANYTVKIPVAGNISLVIDFNPSSD